MPGKSVASLRPRDPHGFGRSRRDASRTGACGFGRAVIILAAAMIIVAAAPMAVAAAPRQPSRPHASRPTHRIHANLKPLWSAYPLRPRRASSRERAIPRTQPPASQRANSSGQDQGSRHASSLASVVTVGVASAAGVAGILLLLLAVRRRRRSRASTESEHQGPWRLVSDSGRGDDSVAPTDRREPSTADRVELRAATDGGRAAVDWRHDGHLLFVPTSTGYSLVERPGDVPEVLFELDGQEFGIDGRLRVSKIGASPLPSDDRECAYLERA